jgi:hypothetical protein
MPFSLYWPKGLQDAVQYNPEFRAVLDNFLGGSIFDTPGSNIYKSAASDIESFTADLIMDDPYVLTETSVIIEDSPITVFKDILGDPTVTQVLADSIRQTDIRDIFDRGEYNNLELIDWDALDLMIDQSGIEEAVYTYTVPAPETGSGRALAQIDIMGMLQGLCLTHGARMVWEYNETKRAHHLTFIKDGGQSIAEATLAARVIPTGGLLAKSPIRGEQGGDWYFTEIQASYKRQDTGTEDILAENEDGRIRHSLGNKVLEIADTMTLLPSDTTTARQAIFDRLSAAVQRWSTVQYKHVANLVPKYYCRIPVGAYVLFNEPPLNNRAKGKRNDGDILAEVRSVTFTPGEQPTIAVEFITENQEKLGIAPTLYLDGGDLTLTGTTLEIAATGLPTSTANNKSGDPNGGLVDSAFFGCYDYNKATDTVEARSCSCGDYAITIFRRGVARLYFDAAYAYASQNVWRGTINVDTTDLAAGSATITLDNANQFDDTQDYVVKFDRRDSADLQACQYELYGFWGDDHGQVTDSAGTVPAKFGFRPGNPTTPRYRSHGGRVYVQPIKNRALQGVAGYEIDSWWWVGIRSAVSPTNELRLEDNINLGEARLLALTEGSAGDNYDWVQDDASNKHVSTELIRSWTDSLTSPKAQNGVIINIIRLSGYEQYYLFYSIFFDFQNDTTPTVEDYEIFGCHPSAGTTAYDWSPFDEGESCATYEMKDIICNNTNLIGTVTIPAYSIPQFDDNDEAMVAP